MNKKALLGLSVALLIPVMCYLLLKYASERAVDMPRHYYLDSVITKNLNGRQVTDTLWHTTRNIHLINQLGDTVSLYDKPGRIIVADFFFTSCAGICPVLTRHMSMLQQSFIKGGNTRKKIDTSIVQFMSFSIDPERDSAAKLKEYADRFGVNHDNWWLLTGNRDSIYRFVFEEMKVDKYSDEPVSPDFVHTSRFVLIDKEYKIRGYYNGLDTVSISKLARDIGLLMLEKDEKKKNTVFRQIIDLSWLWLVILCLIVFFMLYLRNRKKVDRLKE
jgi:protein SCO1/2